MWRKSAVTVVAVLALAACSSSGSGGGSTPPPAAKATAAAAETPSTPAPAATVASPTPEATAQAAAVAVDPCSLLTAAEAGALVGSAVEPAHAQTLDGGGTGCFYSAGSSGVAQLIVTKATSAADANAMWDQVRSKATQELQQAAGSTAQLNPTFADVTGVGDRASTASYAAKIGPVTLAGSAIYVLSGSTFFGVSVVRLNGAAPTPDALKTEAHTVLGRL